MGGRLSYGWAGILSPGLAGFRALPDSEEGWPVDKLHQMGRGKVFELNVYYEIFIIVMCKVNPLISAK